MLMLSSSLCFTANGQASVKIGKQVWTSKNLDVSTFRNGDAIQQATTREEWRKAGENKQPAWCYYDYDPAYNTKYGKLYNWYAVTDSRGLAPKGWHVPGDDEWQIMIDFLGGESDVAKKMKSVDQWKLDEDGTNESGFDGPPGGQCMSDGGWGMGTIGLMGIWWSSTEAYMGDDLSIGLGWRLMPEQDDLGNWICKRAEGLSLRCLKD